MGIRDKLLITAISMSMTNGCYEHYDNRIENLNQAKNEIKIPNGKNYEEFQFHNTIDFNTILQNQENTNNQIYICLKTDDENSFTHTNVLESVSNPENTILEFPVSQLFQKYGNRPHPATVKGIKKDFKALLGKDGIEDLSDKIPQKLSPRTKKITSNTQYELGDTIRFPLINPSLKGVFPKYLSDQLKEEGFQSFSDPDSLEIVKKVKNKNQNIKESADKKADFTYDIVVKKLPTGEGVLALYRDGELFMATYVSVGLNSKKTKTGQFEVLWTNPYYFSRKYKSPMSGCLYYDEEGRGIHQGNVTKRPASHGCIRKPRVYADISYSLVYPAIKNKKHVDVFISNNLYKQEK